VINGICLKPVLQDYDGSWNAIELLVKNQSWPVRCSCLNALEHAALDIINENGDMHTQTAD